MLAYFEDVKLSLLIIQELKLDLKSLKSQAYINVGTLHI